MFVKENPDRKKKKKKFTLSRFGNLFQRVDFFAGFGAICAT